MKKTTLWLMSDYYPFDYHETPNVRVDRARRLHSTFDSIIKLRNTLPAPRPNDLLGRMSRVQ